MMKRFKFGLVGIVLGLFLLTCFSYGYSKGDATRIYLGKSQNQILTGGYCVVGDSNYTSCQSTYVITNSGNTTLGGKVFCNDNETKTIHNGGGNSCPIFIFDGSILNNDCPVCEECEECQECPEFNTGEVYSGWIKETDVDALWSKCLDMGFTEGNSSGYSTLYINDIWHQSAPFINITIPEEFDWDYNYTGNDTQFDLVISGYNVNNEYIDGIIRTQKFTPDEEDFNNIITQVIPLLIPGLVIILFIWFIFRFIKKLF